MPIDGMINGEEMASYPCFQMKAIERAKQSGEAYLRINACLAFSNLQSEHCLCFPKWGRQTLISVACADNSIDANFPLT